MRIPVPHQSEVSHISFHAAPPFRPSDTAYDMLVFLMEQPWADIKRGHGGVVIADLRQGAGQGRVVATFEYSSLAPTTGGSAMQHEPAKVLKFRPREKAPQ